MVNDVKGKPWVMRDVPEATRRLVRVYAAEYGITLAEALTELVQYAYDAHKAQVNTKE